MFTVKAASQEAERTKNTASFVSQWPKAKAVRNVMSVMPHGLPLHIGRGHTSVLDLFSAYRILLKLPHHQPDWMLPSDTPKENTS